MGCQQARDAGHRVREQFGAFDYVYHSGYRRAAQTADASDLDRRRRTRLSDR